MFIGWSCRREAGQNLASYQRTTYTYLSTTSLPPSLSVSLSSSLKEFTKRVTGTFFFFGLTVPSWTWEYRGMGTTELGDLEWTERSQLFVVNPPDPKRLREVSFLTNRTGSCHLTLVTGPMVGLDRRIFTILRETGSGQPVVSGSPARRVVSS